MNLPLRSQDNTSQRHTSICRLLMMTAVMTAALALNASSQGMMAITESVAKHAAIEKPAPAISELARQMKVSGKVEVAVIITDQGAVKTVKVVSGNALLAEGVVIAVRQWKFRPFAEAGVSVPVTTTLSFEFKQ